MPGAGRAALGGKIGIIDRQQLRVMNGNNRLIACADIRYAPLCIAVGAGRSEAIEISEGLIPLALLLITLTRSVY